MKPPNSVLLVANYRPDVGFAWWLMERFWVLASECARKSGYRSLLAYPESGVLPQAVKEAGIQSVVLKVPSMRLMGLLWFLLSNRVRVVYFTDRPFSSSAYALMRAAGVRRIIVHDHTPGDRPAMRGARYAIKTLLRRLPWVNADRVFVVSPLVADRAVYNACYPRRKVRIVQNGVRRAVQTRDRETLRRELRLPTDAIVCVSVGRVSTYKRVDSIIEIAQMTYELAPDIPLYFLHCGDGPELEAIRARVAISGLEDRVRLIGKRSDVGGILSTADLALHTSKGEAFSLAVVEAMASALPIVLPDIPTVCQAVTHGVDGFVYQDADLSSAAAHLVSLARDPDLRLTMGAAAAATVESRFSQERMEDDFVTFFDEILSETPSTVGSQHST